MPLTITSRQVDPKKLDRGWRPRMYLYSPLPRPNRGRLVSRPEGNLAMKAAIKGDDGEAVMADRAGSRVPGAGTWVHAWDARLRYALGHGRDRRRTGLLEARPP
jgi:hypothetical protein